MWRQVEAVITQGALFCVYRERPEARVISECPMLGKPKIKLTLLDVLTPGLLKIGSKCLGRGNIL